MFKKLITPLVFVLALYSSFAVSKPQKDRLTPIYDKFGDKMFTIKASHERSRVIVLFDLECGYCRMLIDKTVPTLVKNGVTVSLFPYPKSGIMSEGAQNLVNAWQWANPVAKALYPNADIPNTKNRHFNMNDLKGMYLYMNREVKPMGTPTTLTPDGMVVQGVYQAQDMITYLRNPSKNS